jgi:NAD(P)-dependent dehydrogenase (short-subunit alcohol dehydrogenase family)
MDFSKKTVMVTGAAGNLGRAVADAFLARGADLVLVDLSRESLARAFGPEDQHRLFAPADLFDPDQVGASVGEACKRFGRIDVLCNVAGGFRMGPAVHETPDADWDYLFDINVRSLLHAVRAVAPDMVRHGGGKIINVSAGAALRGSAGMGAYSASKDAVIRLTETMAAELRDKNINVNCVLPSIIDTPANRAAMPHADPKRWVAPEAIADTMLFLASDGARAIHGAAIPIIGLV